jgi:hypothetical protein
MDKIIKVCQKSKEYPRIAYAYKENLGTEKDMYIMYSDSFVCANGFTVEECIDNWNKIN